MPTLTPEQRRKWPSKKTGGGVPIGKKLCRGCAEDKSITSFQGQNVVYCNDCEEWYKEHRIQLGCVIGWEKYSLKGQEFIYNAF